MALDAFGMGQICTQEMEIFYPPDWLKDLLLKDLALDRELWT